jgi:hypothetical protein
MAPAPSYPGFSKFKSGLTVDFVLFDFPQFKPHGSVLVRNKTFDLLHFV